MERVSRVILVFLVLCVWVMPALAGPIVLTPTLSNGPIIVQEEQEFPESHFGTPPPRDVDTLTPSRQPAGLVMEPVKHEPADVKQKEEQLAKKEEPEGVPAQSRVQGEFLESLKGQAEQEKALIAGDLGFFPKTVIVTQDIPVRLFVTGASKKTLCVMIDSFQVRRQVKSQKIEEITFTPKEPGQYRLYCPLNGMEGILIVKEADGSTSQLEEKLQLQARVE